MFVYLKICYMKKFVLLSLLVVCFAISSSAQSAGKGSGERSGSRAKSRKQMKHFDSKKEDKRIKHNGTSYWRKRKSDYNVDGDGFGVGSADKRKRGKKTGTK